MLQLNLGSGPTRMVGYTNIDKYCKEADIIADASKLPFPDDSADKIYTSHMVEHVTLEDFKVMLKEWYRVLKSGGVLMIRCPNIEAYMYKWLNASYKIRWGEGMAWFLGSVAKGEGHINRNFFTPKRMYHIIQAAGFKIKQSRAYSTRSGHMPDGDVLCEAYKKEI